MFLVHSNWRRWGCLSDPSPAFIFANSISYKNYDLWLEKCNYWLDRGYWLYTGLEVHINMVHFRSKPFKCTQCELAFRQKLHLTCHVRAVHEKMKPFNCDQCNYMCDKAFDLRAHVFSEHDKFNCNFCSFKCSQKGKMNVHLRHCHGLNLLDQTN